VCSALTQMVRPVVAKNLNNHALCQRGTSGQLPFLG
jgi:hypothetical protein